MASSLGVGFTVGTLNTQINSYIAANPNQIDGTFLGCINRCDYTATELSNIRLRLSDIITESINRESQRMYNIANELRDRLDQMSCMGDDTCTLFNGLVESANIFIDFYGNLPVETIITKNSNYLNS